MRDVFIVGNELEDTEFQLAPDTHLSDETPCPMSAAELEKKGLIATKECVQWKWVFRKRRS